MLAVVADVLALTIRAVHPVVVAVFLVRTVLVPGGIIRLRASVIVAPPSPSQYGVGIATFTINYALDVCQAPVTVRTQRR